MYIMGIFRKFSDVQLNLKKKYNVVHFFSKKYNVVHFCSMYIKFYVLIEKEKKSKGNKLCKVMFTKFKRMLLSKSFKKYNYI